MAMGNRYASAGGDNPMAIVVEPQWHQCWRTNSTVAACANLIQRHVSDFKMYFSHPAKQPKEEKRWCPPSADYLKINVDGSFVEQSNTLWKCYAFWTDSYKASTAIRNRRLHWTGYYLFVETDSINVRIALNSRSFDLDTCGMLIKDIKSQMGSSFRNIRIECQSRLCNIVADIPDHIFNFCKLKRRLKIYPITKKNWHIFLNYKNIFTWELGSIRS